MLHLRLLLATAPPSGSAARQGVSAVAMAIILTIVALGAIMLAIAARRMATGGRDAGPNARPHTGAARRTGDRPTDAWSEAGRRMPVPPRDAGEEPQ